MTTSADRIAAGVTGEVRGPAGVGVRFVVTAVDERARTWAWEVTLAGPVPVRLRLEHAVTAARGGSVTTLGVHGPSVVVAAYLPIAWLAMRRLVRP